VTISTTIFLYSLSIIAGIVLVVYGLSIKPRKGEKVGAHDLDVSPDSSLSIDAGLNLLPEEDSSKKREA
jgi:hypothetical protein